MSFNIGIGTRLLTRAALASLLGLSADVAMAQSVRGTATYRERIALPAAAVLEAVIQDVSRADPTSVSMMLRRVGTEQTTTPKPAGARPLEGTYWRAIELAGKPTPTQDPQREAHLLFQSGGRVSGSDGCNRVTGSYQLKGDVVRFGQLAGTQMACINIGEIDRTFREAVNTATRLTVAGDRLELSDATGKRVAIFAAGVQASLPSTSSGLTGTSAARQVPRRQRDDAHARRSGEVHHSNRCRRVADRAHRLQ